MGKWRNAFEKSAAASVRGREDLEVEFEPGAPATAKQLSEFSLALGITVPGALLEMLGEFNGVRSKDKYWGWTSLYLNTKEILVDVPAYLAESGNPAPPEDQLRSVVFFAQQNGYAVLFAICAIPFEEFECGHVLALDHETGEFELEAKSLLEFVQRSDYCTLG